MASTPPPPQSLLDERAQRLASARSVVVKVGTGVLTDARGAIDREVLDGLAREIAEIAKGGAERPLRKVIVVSSGAIALGRGALGFAQRPTRMDHLQACAAAGQGVLMRMWSEATGAHGVVAAQVLLTHTDFADRQRYLNARGALEALVSRGAVPVINENDTVSVEEIAFGDNDSLSAQVANLVRADLLVMLSVAPGLLDDEGKRVQVVAAGDRSVERYVRSDMSSGGKGGMVTKLLAARAASAAGATAVIARGRGAGVLGALFRGDDLGTVFLPSPSPVSSRQHWIAHTLRARGTLVVDHGARTALREGRRSLLPSGITAVRGAFTRGDPVDIEGPDGVVFARGLSSFASSEVEKVKGRHTRDLADLVPELHGDEAVHRDDLALLA